MPNVWFTSDLHFGHPKVAELRGFNSVEAHDAALISRFNKFVKPDDVTWILGDLSAGSSAATRHALMQVQKMNGRKRLIAGNHDPIHPMHRDAHKWVHEYWGIFEYVSPFARVSINGTRCMLSHFPYTADRGLERYGQYRLRDEGMPLIHGHLHDACITHPERPNHVHVGVDANLLYPLSMDDVANILPQK